MEAMKFAVGHVYAVEQSGGEPVNVCKHIDPARASALCSAEELTRGASGSPVGDDEVQHDRVQQGAAERLFTDRGHDDRMSQALRAPP
jgi:hypothetical protein